MRTTHITMYLYQQNFGPGTDETDPLNDLRCLHCAKKLGRVRGRILVMSNTMGPGTHEVPVGVPMFEAKCPSCNTVHNIIWQ